MTKAALILIENDADYREALVLVDKLMGSSDQADLARMAARLVEAL